LKWAFPFDSSLLNNRHSRQRDSLSKEDSLKEKEKIQKILRAGENPGGSLLPGLAVSKCLRFEIEAMNPLALSLQEIKPEDRPRVGGKGFALAVMTRGGLRVPPALSIPPEAYLEFVTAAGDSRPNERRAR
jgi:hypothetical protein